MSLFFNSKTRFFVFRSSHHKCSMWKGVLRNFTKFTGKHLCQSLFLIKLQASACNFIKKRLWHRCFHVNFVKFIRTPFYRTLVVAASSFFKFWFSTNKISWWKEILMKLSEKAIFKTWFSWRKKPNEKANEKPNDVWSRLLKLRKTIAFNFILRLVCFFKSKNLKSKVRFCKFYSTEVLITK